MTETGLASPRTLLTMLSPADRTFHSSACAAGAVTRTVLAG